MIVMAVSLPPLSRELLFFQRPPALTSTPFENIAFPDVTSLRLAYLTEIQHTPRFLQGVSNFPSLHNVLPPLST